MRRLLACWLVLGCACDDADEAAKPGDGFATVALATHVVAGRDEGAPTSELRVGTATTTSLQSLKYYVTSIQLCEDLELVGSGFNQPRGCIELYNNMPAGAPDYATYTIDEARADTDESRYIDLMTSEGRAALERPIDVRVPVAALDGGVDAGGDAAADGGAPERIAGPGVYRYGLINFYRPIKVKAEFPIIGEPGAYFRTKAATVIHESPGLSGGFGSERVEIGDTLSGATEELVYMLNNGGALFTFQKPFAVTQADVDARNTISIDLVFNPDAFGQAYEQPCANDPNRPICDPQNGVVIDMPFVRMSPVPRKAGERTRKETYLVDYEEHSQLRIELYYNDADPERSVQGIDTAIVYKASAPRASTGSLNSIASSFVTQRGSVRTNDASVSLLDYRRETNLEGLRRGQNGQVQIHCVFEGGICSGVGATSVREYRYVGDTLVSAP